MSQGAIQIVRQSETLPDDFSLLRREAAAEGYRFVDRLWDEWSAGHYQDGDERRALFAGFRDGEFGAIGAVTPDPYDPAPDLLRLRHLYVRPAFRRGGLGRVLGTALSQQGSALAPRLSLRVADERAAAFWEALGFQRVDGGRCRSHLFRR